MNHEDLIVLETMVACEGFLSKAKSGVSNFLDNSYRGKLLQKGIYIPKDSNNGPATKPKADKSPKAKEISLDEFNMSYRKLFEDGRKVIIDEMKKIRKDKSLAMAAKGYKIVTNDNPKNWVCYSDKKGSSTTKNLSIGITVLDFDIYKVGPNGREIASDDEWIRQDNEIGRRLREALVKNPKTSKLILDYGGDWDGGPWDINLIGYQCDDLADEEIDSNEWKYI